MRRVPFCISNALRSRIVRQAKEDGALATVGFSRAKKTDPQIRSGQVTFFQNHQLAKSFEKLIANHIFGDAECGSGRPEIKLNIEPFQAAYYRRGDHYHWHSDYHPRAPRLLTMVSLLEKSPNLRGGCLELKDSKGNILSARLRMNQVIVFPSIMLHRVAPVIRGERITLTAWVRIQP